MATPFETAALSYLSYGFSVIPLKPRDKKPAIEWKEFQTRKPTEEEIRKWADDLKSPNIGIVTGAVSGLVVLDIDSNEGMNYIQQNKYHLPHTPIVKTMKGWHYYYRLSRGVTGFNSVKLFGKGIPVDTRGEGGYVVAPPSVHPDGGFYMWVDGSSLGECTLADSPEWLTERRKEERKDEKPKNWLQSALAGVQEGERNNTAARLAGHYLSLGRSREETTLMLLGWNSRLVSPLPAEEIAATVESISIAEAKKYTDGKISGFTPCSLADAKKVVNKWLYFASDEIVDVVLATVVSNQYAGDPLWLVIVGPPSSGKTEILRGVDGHPSCYFIGGITDHTLISGLPRVQGTLEKMNGKEIVFVIKDLGGLLSMRADARLDVFQQLREAYDGRLDKEFGSGKRVSWRGKLGFIAGATPAIEEHHALIGNLGERHLYYRETPGDRVAGIKKAHFNQGQEQIMRKEIREAMTGVVEKMKGFDFDSIKISDELVEWIQKLAIVTTTLRTPVSRDGYKKDIVIFDPVPEGPYRFGKSLNLMGRVLSALREHQEMQVEDYTVLVKVSADCLPSIRRRILKAMCERFIKAFNPVKARDVALETGLSAEYCGYILEDLTLLRIVDRTIDTATPSGDYYQRAPYLYRMREDMYTQIDECGLLNVL